MKIIFALVLFFATLLLFLHLARQREGKALLNRAAMQEKNGQYGKACYTYAVAALHSVKPDECRAKIRELWHKYGPFDLSDQLKLIKEGCPSCDRHSADSHHDDTVEIIKEAIGDA